MPTFKTSRLVAVPSNIAYAVAADVAAYKDFLPLLERSTVRRPIAEKDGVKSFKAELMVGYPRLGLREAFTSHVACNENRGTVTATSEAPPFKHMKAVWTITPVGNQSEVSVSIDYAMRSTLLQFAIAGAMDMAVNKIMTAFEARAKAIHNESATS